MTWAPTEDNSPGVVKLTDRGLFGSFIHVLPPSVDVAKFNDGSSVCSGVAFTKNRLLGLVSSQLLEPLLISLPG